MAQLGQHVADDRLAAAREAEFPGGPILTDGGQAAEERALAQLGQ